MKPVEKRGASIRKAGRKREPQPLSKFALAQTRLRLKRVTTEIERATKHPNNPETAHDLRVAIRRFTQCLRTFRELLDPEATQKSPAKRMRKKLRKLMDLCGAKRDYDVGLEVLAEAGLPAEHPAFARFQEHRDRGMRELARSLQKKHWDVMGYWWKQAAPQKDCPVLSHPGDPAARGPAGLADGGIAWDWSASAAENARQTLPGLAGELFRDGEATAAAPSGNYDLFHPFRLRVKRLRYTLEVFAPCYGEALGSKLRALRGLQDRMGAINDCVVVLKLPGMDRSARTAVRQLLAARDARFRTHWRKSFSLRSQDTWERLLSTPQHER